MREVLVMVRKENSYEYVEKQRLNTEKTDQEIIDSIKHLYRDEHVYVLELVYRATPKTLPRAMSPRGSRERLAEISRNIEVLKKESENLYDQFAGRNSELQEVIEDLEGELENFFEEK